MDKNTSEIFIRSIRSALTKKGELTEGFDVKSLWEFASMHDLAHLVSLGFFTLNKSGLLGEYNDKFTSAQVKAMFRHVKIVKELNDMASAFERIGVDFIFLKGSKLRFYYPEPWMRTSSDIDVLIKGCAEKDACEVFEKLNYKYLGEHQKSVKNYDTPSGVHIELHTAICDNGDVADELLKKVWDTAVLEDGFSHKYRMDDCTFLFHHVAHMAKHFCNGGCGVRPFIDLFVLNNRGESKEFFDMIFVAGLTDFYRAVKELVDCWFRGALPTYPCGMDEYVLRGGLFGTYENAVEVNAKNGKIRYILDRVFPPYVDMKDTYPSLKKQKWLLPFYYVARWFKLFFKFLRGAGRDELKAVSNIDKKRVNATQKLFENLGLRQ